MISLALVDDHQILREGLRKLVEENGKGQVVLEAEDGKELIAGLPKTQPHVAIIDIEMPEPNGIVVIDQVRKRFPEVKTIALTMHTEPKLAKLAFQAGAQGYVLKDEAFDDLWRAIVAVTEGQKFKSPALCSTDFWPMPKSSFSERELDVLYYLSQGLHGAGIGRALGLSRKTVFTIKKRIMKKLHFVENSQLRKYAYDQRAKLLMARPRELADPFGLVPKQRGNS